MWKGKYQFKTKFSITGLCNPYFNTQDAILMTGDWMGHQREFGLERVGWEIKRKLIRYLRVRRLNNSVYTKSSHFQFWTWQNFTSKKLNPNLGDIHFIWCIVFYLCIEKFKFLKALEDDQNSFVSSIEMHTKFLIQNK